MPVLGFNFDKISVDKKGPIKPPLKINTNLKVRDINKENITLGGKDDSVLKFDIEFNLNYEPKFATLNLAGHLLFVDKNKAIEKILQDWKKKKAVPNDVMQMVLNTALMKCNIKALILAQDVNLPPHLKLPLVAGHPTAVKKAKKKSKAEQYIG